MYRKPIKYIIIYLMFTLIAYVITYAKTESHNMFFTVIVCCIYYLAMLFGYYSITFRTTDIDELNKTEDVVKYSNKIKYIIFFASIATIIVSIVNVFSFYSLSQMSLDFIMSPGESYEYVKEIRRNEIEDTGMITISSSLLGLTLNTLSFTKFIVITFIPLFWNQISKTIKIVGIISVTTYIIHAFFIGAMINIGIIVFSLIPILIYVQGTNRVNIMTMSKNGKLLFRLALFSAILLIVFFMGSRYVSVNSGVGDIFSAGFDGLSFYISHGYVGLSTCFDLPFTSTFGASTFHGLATKLLSVDIYNSLWADSYLMRNQAQTGWQALQVWSTIFPWIASDISFLLIPIVMLFIGRFMGKVWRNAVVWKNPYAFLMMSQLMIFAFMIPANNQLFHSFGNSVGTVFIYLMYRISLSSNRFRLTFK